MSGVYIESAYYGDEKAFANITKSLASKIVGGVLDVTASSELKPTFEAAPETRLDSRDEKAIREQAVKTCGGEADQACLERMRIKLSEERLREKENENLVKGVIKGDRLTLNIVDDTGKKRKLVTPAGQKLKLENVIGDKATDSTMALPTVDKVQQHALSLLTVVASTFAYVFNIVAPYAVFMREYDGKVENDQFRIAAYVSAGIATFFPGAGYLIIFIFFGFASFFREYVKNRYQKSLA